MTDLKSYTVELSQRNGQFYLCIPDLCLLVHDADMMAAYGMLTREFNILRDRYAEAGLADRFPAPSLARPAAVPRRSCPAARWAVGGISIIALICVVLVGGALALRSAIPQLTTTKLISAVHGLATRMESLSPEAREQLRKDLQTIGGELSFFFDSFSEQDKR